MHIINSCLFLPCYRVV